MRERGVLARVRGDVICIAPPLIVTDEQVDRIVNAVGESVRGI
jgi:adenosylmethionine-8-amino-7-oxononanoate aminotransferase